MALTRSTVVGVLGAGTMGSGIAQVAAVAGHPVIVTDARPDQLGRAQAGLAKAMGREVEKSRLTAEQAKTIENRVAFRAMTQDGSVFAGVGLVIEAIVEDLVAKQESFRWFEASTSHEAVLATNTSSLSVTAIAAACKTPERVIGIHFFNPAPLLPLVEIVPGLATSDLVAIETRHLVDSWGKTTVVASDTPGFIVNRIARPFYSEALRIFEEGIADKATIDWALRDVTGFRMGPFELMDLIGNDVNLAVSQSVFEAFGYDSRYRPFLTQVRMVEGGMLGRKSGRGHYDYRPNAVNPGPTKDPSLANTIGDRVVTVLINAAVDALFWQVATRDDIDLAMTKGVNYPKGLLRWADEIGLATILNRLSALHAEYGEERYRPSPLLKRMARENRTFYS